MTPESYQEMSLIEKTHWWFVARREILSEMVKNNSQSNRKILEIGAGTGGNIDMLLTHGQVSVIEPNEFARQKIYEKFGDKVRIINGALPKPLNLDGQKFDLICLFDVLEHVNSDLESLCEMKKHLNVGGKIILTVPAMQFLWSKHDEDLHHYRRYNLSKLTKLVNDSDLKIGRMGYFNFLLFAPALLVRLLGKIFPKILLKNLSSRKEGSSILNKLLKNIFASENILLNKNIRFPFGLSIFAVIEPIANKCLPSEKSKDVKAV